MPTVMITLVAMLAVSPQTAKVSQFTSGPCSPVIANVIGNVTVTCIGVDPRAIALLNAHLSQKRMELAEKVQEANRWAENYHELERQLAEIRSDRELARQAEDYLHQGELQKAGEILEQILKKEEATIEDTSAAHYSRGLLFQLEFQPQNALPHFEKAYRYRPDDLAYVLGYAQALQAENRFAEAEKLYLDALAKLRLLGKDNPAAYLEQTTAVLNNLGVIYHHTHQFAKAASVYQEVFDLYSKYPHDRSYFPAMAMDFTNLGSILLAINKPTEAEEANKLALQIWYQLARDESPAYLSNAAMTLNNLAGVYSATRKYQEAQSTYQEALAIWRRIAKDNRAALPDVAMTLNALGALYDDMGKSSEANASFREALEIRRQLAKDNPSAYLPDVAESLNDLGISNRITNQLALSERAHEEALGIYRQLIKDNQAVYQPNLATTLEELAVVYSMTQRFTQAEILFQEAIATWRQLAKDNPAAYSPRLAETLNKLGVLYRNSGRLPEAVVPHEEELAINRQLAKDNPAEYVPILAETLIDLGIAYGASRKLEQAEHSDQEALEIGRQLAKKEPSTYLSIVATSLSNLAYLYQAQNRLEEAERCAAEAAETFRQLWRTTPAMYSDYLGKALLTEAQIGKQRKARCLDVTALAREAEQVSSAEGLKQGARAIQQDCTNQRD